MTSWVRFRPRRDEYVDVSALDEVGDDAAHAAGHHGAREAEELQRLLIAEHPLVDVDRLPEGPPVVGSGFPEFIDEFADRHPGAHPCLLYRIPIFEGHDSVTPALWRGLVFMHDNGSSFREAVTGYACGARRPSYPSVLENPWEDTVPAGNPALTTGCHTEPDAHRAGEASDNDRTVAGARWPGPPLPDRD